MAHYKSLFLAVAFLAFCWFAFERVDEAESFITKEELKEAQEKIEQLEAFEEISSLAVISTIKEFNAQQKGIKQALFLIYPDDQRKIENVFKKLAPKNNNVKTKEKTQDKKSYTETKE